MTRPTSLAPRPAPTRGCRNGFTLVELILAMSVASILVGAVAAALYVAGQALPNRQSPQRAALIAAVAIDEMLDDLSLATSFSERSATAVTFAVADRTGDAAPESIRYAWDGVAGGKLTRAVNGATPRVVVSDVSSLALTFDVTTQITPQTTYNEVDSGEVLLNSLETLSGVSFTSVTRSLSTTSWTGTWFPVVVPAGAYDIRITRAQVRLRNGTLFAVAAVESSIHLPNATTPPTPSSTELGSPASVLTLILVSSLTWTEFTFSDVFVPTGEPALFMVLKASGYDAARTSVLVASAPCAPFDRAAVWTSNSGSTWSPPTSEWDLYELPAYIYGSYKTRAAQTTPLSRYFVRSASIRLETTGGGARPIVVGVELLNQPEVATP